MNEFHQGGQKTGLSAALRGSCILSMTSRCAKRCILPKTHAVLHQGLQMTTIFGGIWCSFFQLPANTESKMDVLFVVCACIASVSMKHILL